MSATSLLDRAAVLSRADSLIGAKSERGSVGAPLRATSAPVPRVAESGTDSYRPDLTRDTATGPAEDLAMGAAAVAAVDPAASAAYADALLRTILEDHSAAMFRVAISIVRDPALAEDVVQESLMKAWQGAASFRGDASLKSWALRIAHNTAISTLRKRREDVRDPAMMPEQGTTKTLDREVQGKMMVDQLWVALAGMEEVSKTIVVLRELEGMSYDEISETLSLPLPTVKTRLFRARRQLAVALKEWA